MKVAYEISPKISRRIECLAWFKIVRRNNSPFLESLIRVGATFDNPKFEFSNSIKSLMTLDRDSFGCTGEYKALQKNVVEKAQQDPEFLERYFELVRSDYNHFFSVVEEINQNDFSILSNGELSAKLAIFLDAANRIASHLWPPLAPEDWLLNEIKNALAPQVKSEQEMNETLSKLVFSAEPSAVQQRKEAIHRLAGQIRKKEKTAKQISPDSQLWKIPGVAETFERFAWIPDNGVNFLFENKQSFLGELKKEATSSGKISVKLSEKKIQLKKLTLARQLGLSERTLLYCRWASELAPVRNLRIDAITEGCYRLRDFFAEIGRRIRFEKVHLFFSWEIQEALEGKTLRFSEIRKRKNGFGLAVLNDCLVVTDASTARRIKRKIEESFQAGTIVKGNVACLGMVRGIVRVLLSPSEIPKLCEGEILVTSMTTPDFVPAMKKAAAIVTDEGGLSCHAAIISRELNKPCIIGTKIATKIFKDGDLVEVNANTGIIKKL